MESEVGNLQLSDILKTLFLLFDNYLISDVKFHSLK